VAPRQVVHTHQIADPLEHGALVGSQTEIEDCERLIVTLEPQRRHEPEHPDEKLPIRPREEPDWSCCVVRHSAAHCSGAVGREGDIDGDTRDSCISADPFEQVVPVVHFHQLPDALVEEHGLVDLDAVAGVLDNTQVVVPAAVRLER
jgi:hypothetical protein